MRNSPCRAEAFASRGEHPVLRSTEKPGKSYPIQMPCIEAELNANTLRLFSISLSKMALPAEWKTPKKGWASRNIVLKTRGFSKESHHGLGKPPVSKAKAAQCQINSSLQPAPCVPRNRNMTKGRCHVAVRYQCAQQNFSQFVRPLACSRAVLPVPKTRDTGQVAG